MQISATHFSDCSHFSDAFELCGRIFGRQLATAQKDITRPPPFCIARGREEELIKIMKRMTGFTDMLVNAAREEEKVVIVEDRSSTLLN
jgi:hypothetical protein